MVSSSQSEDTKLYINFNLDGMYMSSLVPQSVADMLTNAEYGKEHSDNRCSIK